MERAGALDHDRVLEQDVGADELPEVADARAEQDRHLADAQLVDDWKGDVGYAATAEAKHALLLVRPDGYVAWVSDETHPATRASAVRKALTEWCGEPR